jgi:mannose-6-phosphate isomerase
LFKIIDAAKDLSIQVHPDDDLAQRRGMPCGKTEMWYVMEADPGARLISGFRRDTDPEEYQAALAAGHLEDLLHAEEPEAGDVYFIPAGRVHALGKGLMVAEIQQTSDCTYRIYDYNRRDADGKLRELHTAEALDAIDFSELKDGKTHYTYKENSTTRLAECPYFTTNLIPFTKPLKKDFNSLDSFVIYLCVEGIAAVKSLNEIVPIHAGECVLVPAVADTVELFPSPKAKLLEVYIDPAQWKGESPSHVHDNDWLASLGGSENWVYRSNCRIKSSETPVFIGGFVNQGA